MDISTALNIKKQKLGEELAKANPNKQIVFRLQESIRRHQNEMRALQRRRRRNWKRKRNG